MAETLYATSHITGSCSSPGNAVGAGDGSWTSDSGDVDWTSRWAMGNPSGGIGGTQTIDILCRKAGTGGADPSLVANLYENGSLVQEVIASTTVANDTTGETKQGTFDGSVISNEADVEVEIVATASGGNPTGRRTVQVDEIKWTAELAPAVSIPVLQRSYRNRRM